jgi:hypothetical protein
LRNVIEKLQSYESMMYLGSVYGSLTSRKAKIRHIECFTEGETLVETPDIPYGVAHLSNGLINRFRIRAGTNRSYETTSRPERICVRF